MFGDELVEVLPEHRLNAESRMTETVEFFMREPAGEDPVTFQPLFDETVIASGVRARVRNSLRESRDVSVAGQLPVVSQMRVDVPVGSVQVGPSVWIRVLSSAVDAGLVGLVFRTKDSAPTGQVTAWRYPVEQVS